MTEIQRRLFELQDLSYRDFHSRLMPTINKENIIGVRTPQLRKLGKELMGSEEFHSFLEELPHTYYEENNLHAFFLEQMKDYQILMDKLELFLPYMDNWATCDMMSPKVFKTHLLELEEKVQEWLSSQHTYTIRFGVNMLMKFYLDEHFSEKYLAWVADVHSEEYYVKMVVAWYFATALAKQYDATIPYIENGILDVWTHNKTIQKSIESYRITNEQKTYLRTLKRQKTDFTKTT